MNYYVICCDEDGDHSIEELCKEAIEERLAENYYGTDAEVITSLSQKSNDMGYMKGIIILKGELVIPKAVTKVSAWEV